MHTPVAVANPLVTSPLSERRSNDSSPYAVEHLSDAALLAGARGLVAHSNQQLARLLAHLAEVDARGIHRARACASLCAYCVYELRLSEDMAFRYARAAKLARAFPVLFEQIAAGEIHLTGLLLLGPHLTEGNHREVLRLAKHRSKREITKLVRRLDPLPDVPARIEPLGPASAGEPRAMPAKATWSAFMQALNPVRELAPRDRPSNWLSHGAHAESADCTRLDDAEAETRTPTGAQQDWPVAPAGSAEPTGAAKPAELGLQQAGSADSNATGAGDVELGPTWTKEHDPAAPWLKPQRYSVQFTATQEYVDLVERARDLLSHAVPSRSLAEIHLRAMRQFVTELEKRRFGRSTSGKTAETATNEPVADDCGSQPSTPGGLLRAEVNDAARLCGERRGKRGFVEAARAPRRRGERGIAASSDAPRGRDERGVAASSDDPRGRDERGVAASSDAPRGRDERSVAASSDAARGRDERGVAASSDAARRRDELGVAASSDDPRRRGEHSDRAANQSGRYIPADVRREVQNRDGGRCAYVAVDGQRCRETSFLELHHHDPYAHGGAARIENLSLYCRAHNALAAERDFGRSYMARRSGRE